MGSAVFFDAPKRGFSVILELLPQFQSQNVQILRICSSNHGQKLVGSRILIYGTSKKLKGVNNGKKHEVFYYLSQNLQIWRECCFWVPDIIYVEKSWFGGSVVFFTPHKGIFLLFFNFQFLSQNVQFFRIYSSNHG